MRLIIPSGETKTIYKSDYLPKSRSAAHLKLKMKRTQFQDKKIALNFSGLTIYQQEFKKARATENSFRVLKKLSTDQDAPRFMETQYSHAFLNWGA